MDQLLVLCVVLDVVHTVIVVVISSLGFQNPEIQGFSSFWTGKAYVEGEEEVLWVSWTSGHCLASLLQTAVVWG